MFSKLAFNFLLLSCCYSNILYVKYSPFIIKTHLEIFQRSFFSKCNCYLHCIVQIMHFVSADEHSVDPLCSNNSFEITRSMEVHLRSVHHLRQTEYWADSLLHHHLLILNFIKNTVILQWPKGSRIQSSTRKHE